MPSGINQATRTYFFGPINIKIEHLTGTQHTRFDTDPKLSVTQQEAYNKAVLKDIKEKGLINPLTVHWYLNNDRNINRFLIARGLNRYSAVKKLGWKEVPCYVGIFSYRNIDKSEWLQEQFCEGLKKLMPFVRSKQFECMADAVPLAETFV